MYICFKRARSQLKKSKEGKGNGGCRASEVGDKAAILDEGSGESFSEEIADEQGPEEVGRKEQQVHRL